MSDGAIDHTQCGGVGALYDAGSHTAMQSRAKYSQGRKRKPHPDAPGAQPSPTPPVWGTASGMGTPAQHPLTQSRQRPWEWEPWNIEKQLCTVQHGHHLLCSMEPQESG